MQTSSGKGQVPRLNLEESEMQMRSALFTLGTCILSLVSIGGCTWTDGDGLDLSVRGRLTLSINRESGSAKAKVFGSVNDLNAWFFPVIVLSNTQVLSVNDVKATHALGFFDTEIGAVNAPSGYTVTFDDKGTIKSLVVTPPVDFSGLTPADTNEVSRTGFDITWSPSGDPDVRVEVRIRGLSKNEWEDDDDDEPGYTLETISNLSDSGSVTVGEPDLAKFLNGEIELRVTRYRKYSGDLGFKESSIRVSCVATRSVILTD